MSDAAADLLARMLAARERWIDVGDDGAALCVRRPAEAQMAALRGGLTPESAAAHVVRWRGVTVGAVLGAAASEAERGIPAPFTPELAAAVLLDRVGWLNAVAEALADMVGTFLDGREAAAKN